MNTNWWYRGGNHYGGSAGSKYAVEIHYGGVDWDFTEHVYPEFDKEFRKKVEVILLNQVSNGPITIKPGLRRRPQTIIGKGDSIQAYDIQKLLAYWSLENFKRTRFYQPLKKMQESIVRSRVRAKKPTRIRIAFEYKDSALLSRSSLAINRKFARWLGEKLIEAADHNLPDGGVRANVTGDGEVIKDSPIGITMD